MNDSLIQFMELVLERNKVMNLTAITDRDEFKKKHLEDSLACVGWDQIENAKSVIDIGSGAGFPGIPLAVMYPDKEFLLVDSLNKRVEFINAAVMEIGINNVKAVHGRAEDLGRDKRYRGRFDLCVSRAIAKLSVLCEYCIPFVKVGGYLYAYKGLDVSEEIDAAGIALRVLGSEVEDVRATGLGHSIITIKKKIRTDERYPRKAGTPKKAPL